MFVHLHTHSHYSLLDGLGKIPDMIARAKELGMNALALTDHGNLYGLIEFYKECKKNDVKPILGMEAYMAAHSLYEKRPHIDDRSSHLVLLAKNLAGYKNLLKLSTIAHLEGFYYKPRIDKETLRKHSEGLIVLSGCLKGELAQLVRTNDKEAVRCAVQFYLETFGRDDFFIELQHHPEIPVQNEVNKKLIELAEEYKIKIVATRDVHYIKSEDAEAQDILLCIQIGKTVDDPTRLSMRDVDYSMCSSEVMEQAFRDAPEAVSNTGAIAEMCNVELELGKWRFPKVELPEGANASDYLREKAYEGLNKFLPNASEEIKKRLDYELDVIIQKGYAPYFFVVADYASWSRGQGIVTTTRGSAAGSLVGYTLGITTVNPLYFNLPFERFLNPYRPSPPDIDVDFADDRRGEVINYIVSKYGKDKVAQICTFGRIMARAAVRDVTRSLGFPYSLGDRIAKMIPFGNQGFPMSIAKAKEISSELKEFYNANESVRRILDLAEKIEECARHVSVHAAGVVIAPEDLTESIPLQYEPGGEQIITQYEMDAVEAIGQLKMDILGVRNLSILGNAVKLIEKTKNQKIDLTALAFDDEKTYKLLARGETIGLFQLGGSGMTRYLKELRPTTIFDIMAMIALYRPGPMESIPEYIKRKHGKSKITYLHPKMEPILNKTYGVITFQEDVLEVAIALAGYTWETVDGLRKAIGKKIPKEMAKHEKIFIDGCQKYNGLTEAKAREIWDLFRPFQGYGFNRAHAASYAVVAYHTAYLKAQYPAEFMTAVLAAEAGDNEKIREVVKECREMGIEVLPPDVAESRENFTYIDDKHIRFGLLAIKNLGEEISRVIIDEREKGGPFKDLADFVGRINSRNFNKKSLEALILAGALDSFGERGNLLANADLLLQYNRDIVHEKENKQINLFSVSKKMPASPPASQDEPVRDVSSSMASGPALRLKEAPPVRLSDKLKWEKELLGLYISDHPFSAFASKLKDYILSVKNLSSYFAGKRIVTGGIISSLRQFITKNKELMYFANLEDMNDKLDVVIFPSVLKGNNMEWKEDIPVVIWGKLDNREGKNSLICDKVVPISEQNIKEVVLSILHQGS
jgi:DNA polymerase-3 subunit alpha